MACGEYIQGEKTLKPYPNFNAETDCISLHDSKYNENTIVDILAHRSYEQREAIKKQYKTSFGQDLEEKLKSKLSGNMEKVALALCRDRYTFDAEWLYKAMKGLGTNEDVLIEIICTRSPEELIKIKEQFKILYNKTLEEFIEGDTAGDFKKFLISLVQSGRPDSIQKVDQAVAKADADALYKAGESRWGTDEATFNRIFCSKSFAHLKYVFYFYHQQTSHTIEAAIKNEMSGDIKNAYLTLYRCIYDKASEFANRLLHSMKGLGTNDDALIRIVVSRAEVDMENIKAAFTRLPDNKKGESLAAWIKDDTSGNYQKILLALIGEN